MPSKKPLLLLPGMMCDSRLWKTQIDGLADICCPIKVGDISGARTIERIARQVLARAPSTFALAGLSMGGIVAFEMWRQAAQRITHLALLDTNARAEIPERQALRQGQIDRAHRGALRELMMEELKPNYLARANKTNQALLDSIFSMAQALGPGVFENQSVALRDRPDSCATLSTIDCPLLIICGEEDQLCPVDHHRFMANEIPDAKLLVLENCGHLSTIEQPQRVTQAMREWLAPIS
ncbi:MAG: alpha/beta fold hydrolase [Pseudomonadales bacterium]